MEYKFVLALAYPNVYPLGADSPYFATCTKYIGLFYDEFDVISDMRIYFELFGPTDAQALKGYIREKLDEQEKLYQHDGDDPPNL